MKFYFTLVILVAMNIFLVIQSYARSFLEIPESLLWSRSEKVGLQSDEVSTSNLLNRRDHQVTNNAIQEKEVEDEKHNYYDLIFENLEGTLNDVQPKVDEIDTLSKNANDGNVEETVTKISSHLMEIIKVGNSFSSGVLTGEEEDVKQDSLTVTNCNTCHKKHHHHHRHRKCHKCRRRSHFDCAHLLWRWLKCCKICISAILSCKVQAVREKCKEHLPKITYGCAKVVTTCGDYNVRETFKSVASVDIIAYIKLGYGASAISNA